MNNAIHQYFRAVKKNLHGDRAAVNRLLADFQPTLDSFLEEHPSADDTEIAEAFGPPEEIARDLNARLTAQEAASYRRTCQIKKWIGAAALVAVIAFTLYVWFFKSKPLTYKDEVGVVEPTNSTSVQDTAALAGE